MIVTIPIAFVSPGTGEIREQPLIPLFYAAIAGMIIIILYSSYKNRKQKDKAQRRSKK
jgi:hypothetical protein